MKEWLAVKKQNKTLWRSVYGNAPFSCTIDWTERISLLSCKDWALSISPEVSGGREDIISNDYKKNVWKI